MVPRPEGHDRVPEVIPTKPDIDVRFDALSEREPIGSGGTADVIKMVDESTGEVLAVKQPRLEGTLSEEGIKQFISEAETWEKLDSIDGIVGVIDWGETPIPWIGLEYMDGGPLTSRFGDVGLEQGLWIGTCAADTIWEAHRRGVAHLDLKPDNILFRETRAGQWDVPKVSDWGLAKLLLHHSQSVEGFSPRYSAPEQFDTDTYGSPDDLTDIYQLGTIVYQLLTGDPVFSGATATVMNSHLTEQPDPPTSVEASLPQMVDDVVRKALEKRKEDRYESMLDFRRDLLAVFRYVAFNESPSLIANGQTLGGDNQFSSTHRPREDDKPSQYEGDGSQSPEPTKDRNGSTTGRVGDEKSDESTVDFTEGSSFEAGREGTEILDQIQRQTQSEDEKQFPWQHRDEPPGLENETIDNSQQKETDNDFERSNTPSLDHSEEQSQTDQPDAKDIIILILMAVGMVIILLFLL